MATAGKSVFLIGPGFIGREVLDLLLAEGYSVTALVRRESYAKELQQSGAKTVTGSIDDSATIIQHTIASDIVIHTASANHRSSVQAAIEGVERRTRDNKKTIYIHTSGASVASDDAKGQFKGDKIFSDDKQDEIDALPDTSSHRLIDLTIVRASQRLSPTAKLAIIAPPLIYGANPKYNRLSIQLPTLTRFALKHGYAGHVGKGASVWSEIHVLDLARAYITLLHWLEKGNADQVPETSYFFCENGHEVAWRDAAAEIGKALHGAGRIESPEPKEIPEDQYGDLFGSLTPRITGSNSRSRAKKLRELGWEPKEKRALESLVEDEIPLILKETAEFNGYAGWVGPRSS
jgi:nucleoside-diphosphate-sugar epimerase